MKKTKVFLLNNKDHFMKIHDEWRKRFPFNHSPSSPNFLDQCYACQYYVRLQGLFESSWGVCSNPDSQLFGRVQNEHDGCDKYSFAEDEPAENL